MNSQLSATLRDQIRNHPAKPAGENIRNYPQPAWLVSATAENYRVARRQAIFLFSESSDNHPTKRRNHPMKSANRPTKSRNRPTRDNGHRAMKLKVQQAASEDVYRDIVRVSERYRADTHGVMVPEGSVCRISAPGGTAYGILRGLGNSSERVISMDERLRNLLDVSDGDEVELQFKKVGSWGQFRWAWNASDPAYRVAARLGLLSVILGALGLLLGLISLRGCL